MTSSEQKPDTCETCKGTGWNQLNPMGTDPHCDGCLGTGFVVDCAAHASAMKHAKQFFADRIPDPEAEQAAREAKTTYDPVSGDGNRSVHASARAKDGGGNIDPEGLIDIIETIYAQYDGGPQCYEYEGGEPGAYIGVAVHIDEETEDKIIALLNAKRPRNAPADKAGGEKL